MMKIAKGLPLLKVSNQNFRKLTVTTLPKMKSNIFIIGVCICKWHICMGKVFDVKIVVAAAAAVTASGDRVQIIYL